jgi:hypothetical protein
MLLTIELELANRTKGNLEMVKAEARVKATDLNRVLAEMLAKPRDTGEAAEVEGAAKQAADYFEWANNTDKVFRIGVDHALEQDDQATLAKAAEHLGVDLQSAVRSRPPRSWPIL